MGEPNFKEIVRAWILEYDDRLPNSKKERIEAFITLLGNLDNYGFKKDDLTESRYKIILGYCVNKNHHKAKLTIWVDMVMNALEAAVLIYYGTVKIKKDIVTPEMLSKIEAIEQKEEEKPPTKEPSDTKESGEDPLDSALTSNEIDSAISKAVKKNNNPEFELTDEILDQMEGPEIVWDSDFNKKLGIE